MRVQPTTRDDLLWETRFVMLAFLFPGISTAIVLVVRHAYNAGGSPSPLGNVVPGHPLVSLLLGIPVYLEVATVAPLALLLLARTGQGPAAVGLRIPGLRSDVWPALGLIGAGFGVDVLLSIPFTPLLKDHPGLINPTQIGHVPGYYVIYGLAVSATTAFGEEVIVNGYILTRLEQLGWAPTPALVLSLTLRTSYHVYYGIGFLFTVPIGYFLTRSFQKQHRLTRPIVAHFLYDAVLITIAVLTS